MNRAFNILVGNTVGTDRERKSEAGFFRPGEQIAVFETPDRLKARRINSIFGPIVQRMCRAIPAT